MLGLYDPHQAPHERITSAQLYSFPRVSATPLHLDNNIAPPKSKVNSLYSLNVLIPLASMSAYRRH